MPFFNETHKYQPGIVHPMQLRGNNSRTEQNTDQIKTLDFKHIPFQKHSQAFNILYT